MRIFPHRHIFESIQNISGCIITYTYTHCLSRMHARCARGLNVTTTTWNNYKLTVIPPDGRDRPLRSSDLFVPKRMLMIGEQRYMSEDFYSEEWIHKRDSLVICLAGV